MISEKIIFEKDPYGNPFKRYCKFCNQQQDQHQLSHKPLFKWWETMGKVINEFCLCHNYAEYYSDDFII